MPTLWSYPNTITQFSEVEQHVSWQENFNNITQDDKSFLSTSRDLIHIANSVVNDIKEKTFYLQLTNFNLVEIPSIISGIEFEMQINRGGRITDETVQLTLGGVLIGDNKAQHEISVLSVYGDSSDTWGLELTQDILQDPTFGLVLRYQSHPSWPHKESPKLNYVKLRVW